MQEYIIYVLLAICIERNNGQENQVFLPQRVDVSMRRKRIIYYKEIGLGPRRIVDVGGSMGFFIPAKEKRKYGLEQGTLVRPIIFKNVEGKIKIYPIPISKIIKVGGSIAIIIQKPIAKYCQLEKGDTILPHLFIRNYLNNKETNPNKVTIIDGGDVSEISRKDWLIMKTFYEKRRKKEERMIKEIQKEIRP